MLGFLFRVRGWIGVRLGVNGPGFDGPDFDTVHVRLQMVNLQFQPNWTFGNLNSCTVHTGLNMLI